MKRFLILLLLPLILFAKSEEDSPSTLLSQKPGAPRVFLKEKEKQALDIEESPTVAEAPVEKTETLERDPSERLQ